MEIKCEFVNNFGGTYECHVREASISKRCSVKTFRGNHESGKSNYDVKKLSFTYTNVSYLPSGWSNIFPQIKRLEIIKCGLKEITSKDLFGLENLETLWIVRNDLRSLPDDLFIYTRKLKEIQINGNPIEFMSSRLLDPIPAEQLASLSFRENSKINAFYEPNWKGIDGRIERLQTLQELKNLIDMSCSPSAHLPKIMTRMTTNEFKTLWKHDVVSDFTIVIEKLEIRLHKCVLAVKSSVFAAMFQSNESVRKTNKLEIKDCSGEVVEQFMQSLYSGEVQNEESALELFSLACTFDVPELRAVYEDIVVKNMNNKNALKALKLGNLYGSQKLTEAAYSEVKKMLPNEVQSDNLKYNPERVEGILLISKQYKETLKKMSEM